MERRTILILFLGVTIGLLIMASGVWLVLADGGDPKHRYEVKTEQVQASAGYNGTAVPLSDLPGGQQHAIYEAYKETDHFLGGASVRIELNEPLNLSEDDRWQVVDIEGVRLLTGIVNKGTHTPATVMDIGGVVLLALGYLWFVVIMEVVF